MMLSTKLISGTYVGQAYSCSCSHYEPKAFENFTSSNNLRMTQDSIPGDGGTRRVTVRRDQSEEDLDELDEAAVDGALMDTTTVARRVREQIDTE